MKKSRKNVNKYTEEEQAASNALFDRIAADLNLPPASRTERKQPYLQMIRRRYYTRRIGTAAIVIAAAAVVVTCGLILFLPSSPANITTELSGGGGEARVSFSLGREGLVRDVSASMNDSALDVGREGEYYYVDVSDNGVLILETELVTGARSRTDVVIEGLDTRGPSIAWHSREGDTVSVCLTDGEDGSGVDFAAITAREEETGAAVEPLSYDEAEGLVVFAYPERAIRITIPDKAGNVTTAVLTPYVLAS